MFVFKDNSAFMICSFEVFLIFQELRIYFFVSAINLLFSGFFCMICFLIGDFYIKLTSNILFNIGGTVIRLLFDFSGDNISYKLRCCCIVAHIINNEADMMFMKGSDSKCRHIFDQCSI